DALPALVAVHRVVASAHGGDPGAGMYRGKAGLQVADERQRGRWWRVSSVEQRMDGHRRHTLAMCEVGERDQVAVIGVDATRPDERDGVEDTARSLRPVHRGVECRPAVER